MTSTTPMASPGGPDRPGRGAVLPRQRPSSDGGREEDFVAHVQKLCADPGARTALRSGLRKDLDSVPRMHRLVAPRLPQDHTPEDVQRAYYAVAAMIAAQPRHSFHDTHDSDGAQDGEDTVDEVAPTSTRKKPARPGRSSLGAAFAAAVGTGRDSQMRQASAEARLNLLTRQSLPGLHRHLPASVAYLRSLDVDVDFAQLLSDLAHWRRHSGRIARRWLQDYYRLRAQADREEADKRDQEELTEAGAAE
ncbi:type I-E CRISPR-associated protein Cse2/CasB [Streptomyces somaliensis]|uniref:type I-E CRISPR-associated protein Cse2/CasB n=1 Tax=Streptomyces somaliensis TaxID=78355 RepID=UPI0020CE5276|nr:type I-E CRISPR-associated protein Cse2/CasB [Streptomyces somaliensis]MCP9946018.1 type I-E CRISPR-associated protein Cse2/CasB [Streptomyces somaliensis]MCP9960815.1 type I-E CRISPR-associated protein Cse2/CasB [Streptomyces somaliensis]MCP9973601.1 type I-E CRISPR-associated protein Cse2/CasB [Streptomyces somaliensis]